MKLIAKPSLKVTGRIIIPGDKSISHRSIIFSSLAVGRTKVIGFLAGDDPLSTISAMRAMGVNIEINDSNEVNIDGVGLYGLKAPVKDLYMGNSGTSMRLMSGLLAGQKFNSCLYGDESLSKRPMQRVIEPLMEMGANITSNNGCSPLHIKSSDKLMAIEYDMKVVSAQVKSCLLLAGLYANGSTKIIENVATRDHSERMLKSLGADIKVENNSIYLNPSKQLLATDIKVPADISSAAFFMVAACIVPSGEVFLPNIGINPYRAGIINILQAMQADITILNRRQLGNEPVADLLIKSSSLKAVSITGQEVPDAIDEFPIIFIAAACAEGITKIEGISELRLKESDRIQSMVEGLEVLGVKVTQTKDSISIEGLGKDGQFKGGIIESCHDHRIIMSFCIASLRASRPLIIRDSDNIKTSFPHFISLANKVGLNIEKSHE